MLPEQKAREKIDKQLNDSGWEIVSRDEYVSTYKPQVIKEALMSGKKECDYLLFVDNKAIAVIEAKKEEDNLGKEVAEQAENYSLHPEKMYGLWFEGKIPLVYLANGKKILFKNMLTAESEYKEIEKMHTPKEMLKIIRKSSEFGALPFLEKKGLRECQYKAELEFENSLRNGKRRSLAVLATGSGKTYLACMSAYRLLNYTPVDKVLFLADRNNLAKQAEVEFNTFNKTEKNNTLNDLYRINRLRTKDDLNSEIVISTIQKLFSVLTGENIIDDDNDEDEDFFKEDIVNEPEVELGSDLELPPNYFKFIVIDECHRSIYGKWRSVLNYFKDAIILGLTATPTEEAYAFFDKNVIERYTYEDSVLDGVNVPFRVFDIETKRSKEGGFIEKDSELIEVTKINSEENKIVAEENIVYTKRDLDKTIFDRGQIKQVLSTYRDSIYSELYPDREKIWEYIPKTLIFAKNDKHADEIVSAVKEVFGEKFSTNCVPDKFVQKITYSSPENSNTLIKDFRVDKSFRIAVTVTLVATGTDIRPLEVVMFMADVKSDVLYTQMKGRGCRIINDDKLKEVTPNANSKECFFVVDAIGVTKGEKSIPRTNIDNKRILSLKDLLEHLSHGEVSNENLLLLRDYCSSITNRYRNNPLFKRHLDSFINSFGFSPVFVSEKIQGAFSKKSLPEYISPSSDNYERLSLISILIDNKDAKSKLLELKKGYYIFAPETPDETTHSGFSIEGAKKFIENFEICLNNHKDRIEALRIIYNSEEKLITYDMLVTLRDMLLQENKQYSSYVIWNNYKRLDSEGNVIDLDHRRNVNALTNLIQIARYAYKKDNKLITLHGLFSSRFNLYVGSTNHNLNENQIFIMRKIAESIVDDGAISMEELNTVDTDLWRKGIKEFGKETFKSEISMLSKFIIGVRL